jgi:hypothetical protein
LKAADALDDVPLLKFKVNLVCSEFPAASQ